MCEYSAIFFLDLLFPFSFSLRKVEIFSAVKLKIFRRFFLYFSYL